jgi:C-terminal processing protease CtpA/Prc
MTPHGRRSRLLAPLLVGFLAAAAWPLSALSSQGISSNDASRVRGMLKDMYESIGKNYYDRDLQGLDWEARYEEYRDKISTTPSLSAGLGLVAGFVDGLGDSHTYFRPPTWSKRVEYGYDVGIVGNDAFILRVLPGTDAASKLRPGDRVLSINGNQVTRESYGRMQYILNLLTPQVATKVVVRGPDGSEREELVASKVIDGRALTVLGGPGFSTQMGDMVREMEDARYEMRLQSVVLDDLLISKMPTFLVEAGEIDRMISQARKHTTLVLDLRGNPGGFIVALQRLVGSVFEQDQFIGTRVTRFGRGRLSAPTRGNNAFTGRLIVLIDSASGSSAELFARVVQLERRGEVIGDRSAGVVKEAQFFPFAQGSQVILTYGASITSADVLMKDGLSLERVGVTPDSILLPTADDMASGRDPVMSHAAQLAGVALDPVAAAKLFQEKR